MYMAVFLQEIAKNNTCIRHEFKSFLLPRDNFERVTPRCVGAMATVCPFEMSLVGVQDASSMDVAPPLCRAPLPVTVF